MAVTKFTAIYIDKVGKTEIIVVNSEKLYVFDKNSSRLLFWMDLKKGTILSETVNLSDNSSEFVSNLTGSSIAVYNTETMIEKNSNGIIFTKNGIKKIVELDNEGYKVKYSGAVSEILEAVISLQPDYNSLSGKVSLVMVFRLSMCIDMFLLSACIRRICSILSVVFLRFSFL